MKFHLKFHPSHKMFSNTVLGNETFKGFDTWMYVYIASYRVVRFYTEIFGRKFGHVIDLSRELAGSSPIFGGQVSSYSEGACPRILDEVKFHRSLRGSWISRWSFTEVSVFEVSVFEVSDHYTWQGSSLNHLGWKKERGSGAGWAEQRCTFQVWAQRRD